jgi:hypothetical protein
MCWKRLRPRFDTFTESDHMITLRINESQAQLLTEALHGLRRVKRQAYETLSKTPGHHFTPHDFAIPQIDGLIATIDALEDDES